MVLNNYENHFNTVTHFGNPKAAIRTQKTHTEGRL
jgi:hypothetical protein